MSVTPGTTSRRTLSMQTAEGTVLPFERASVFDRLAAVLLDQGIIMGVAGLFLLAALLALAPAIGTHTLSLFLLANFVLRNAYFMLFEVQGGGATPGKRTFHLRVVSRDGGALLPEQVIARNLTREFEVFLPMVVLTAPQGLFPDLPPWAAFMSSAWLLVGALFPLFNRERLRLGDLLGGTIVVAMPRIILLDELSAEVAPAQSGTAAGDRYSFTPEQLDQYGIEQLQVLEQLLRHREAAGQDEVFEAVVRRIEAKIAWDTPTSASETERFLRQFYHQLRSRLEHKVLFGVRQEHKREGRLRRGGTGREPPAGA